MEFITETDNAVLVESDGIEIWIPISQIEDWAPYMWGRGDLIDLNVTTWFLEKGDLDYTE